ncbi:TolC family outer membrane protein [Paracoccaceae bacterium Fryx2]|nr:TolC family outer membrane protein [Paracoccaceae bacterium Fryx2]
MRGIRGYMTAALAAVALMAAPALRAETLTDALIAAYRNSNLLDQNRALLRATDEDLAVAVSNLRPVIDFTARSTYTYAEGQNLLGAATVSETLSTVFVLAAELMLYDYGRRALAVSSAKESVLATREALIDLEQRVLLAAVDAYVRVRLNEEIVLLRQSNVRVITQEQRAAEDRFEVGEVTRTDVAIAESRLASARANLAEAQGNLALARESYKVATGAYPGRLAPPPAAPRRAASLEDARVVARRGHPAIRQAQREVTISDLSVQIAAANMGPTLSARAQLSTDDNGEDTRSLGLTYNQTIYAGGRLSALYRRALAGRDSSRANLLQTVLLIEQSIGNAWANLSVAGASIEATDRQIRAAQTAYDGVREEAALGARTTLDVLNAEQELLDAKASRLSAEATRYIAVYTLLQSMGLLTVDHLRLGIPTYDPAAYYNAVRNAPATSSQGKSLDRVMKSIGRN